MQDNFVQDSERNAVRSIDRLIATYAESHLNPVNEVIHFICVPAIVFTLLGLLWAVHPFVAAGLSVASLLYYMTLSRPMALGMGLMSALMLWLLSLMPQQQIWQTSLVVFVIAWIGQFIGHKIEGKKPSFFDDLRFLMIGPLFVLGFLYRRLHIRY